jgi:hypothetical protein
MTQLKTQMLDQDVWFQQKESEIQNHPAWHGNITGMRCEGILRDRPVNTYLIRQGEKPFHFYLSFVRAHNTFHHQPFIVELNKNGWFYMNFHPHHSDTLEGLVPKIMHCEADQCIPLTKQECASPFYANYSM